MTETSEEADPLEMERLLIELDMIGSKNNIPISGYGTYTLDRRTGIVWCCKTDEDKFMVSPDDQGRYRLLNRNTGEYDTVYEYSIWMLALTGKPDVERDFSITEVAPNITIICPSLRSLMDTRLLNHFKLLDLTLVSIAKTLASDTTKVMSNNTEYTIKYM